jgi:hypothetical protein
MSASDFWCECPVWLSGIAGSVEWYEPGAIQVTLLSTWYCYPPCRVGRGGEGGRMIGASDYIQLDSLVVRRT